MPRSRFHSDACISCGERMQKKECAKSQRPCGHHCNHSWTHDTCCWCGKEFDEEEIQSESTVTTGNQ